METNIIPYPVIVPKIQNYLMMRNPIVFVTHQHLRVIKISEDMFGLFKHKPR